MVRDLAKCKKNHDVAGNLPAARSHQTILVILDFHSVFFMDATAAEVSSASGVGTAVKTRSASSAG